MHLSTRFTRTVAAAMSVAALAVSIGAGSASAAPLDPVGPLNSGNVGYGTSWSGGNATGSPVLNWNQAGVLTTPRLTAPGNIYIENAAGVEARMQIVHYSDAAHTNLIATRDGGTKVGTGAFLDVFPIVLGGVNSTATHVHINLQKNIGGVWTTVAAGSEDL